MVLQRTLAEEWGTERGVEMEGRWKDEKGREGGKEMFKGIGLEDQPPSRKISRGKDE